MSREAELYKDKIEVSLDGRQIFYLFFGGAVIVGLVFVLGVMVGRRVEARGHVDRASVAATVDPLAALDRLEGGAGLSFQGSLRGGDSPASDVEKTIAAMKTEAKTEAKIDAKSGKHDPKKVEAKAEKAEPVVERKAEAKAEKVEPRAEKAAPAVDKKAEAKAEKAEPVKANDPDKLVDAKVEPKAEDKKPKFTLQLSSFQDKTEAQTYLENIKSSGYQAYVTEGAVDGKQYYRVRMGSYRSMDAATEAKAELERTTKKSAIITKL